MGTLINTNNVIQNLNENNQEKLFEPNKNFPIMTNVQTVGFFYS